MEVGQVVMLPFASELPGARQLECDGQSPSPRVWHSACQVIHGHWLPDAMDDQLFSEKRRGLISMMLSNSVAWRAVVGTDSMITDGLGGMVKSAQITKHA